MKSLQSKTWLVGLVCQVMVVGFSFPAFGQASPPTGPTCAPPTTGPFCQGKNYCCPEGQEWTGECDNRYQICRVKQPDSGAHLGHHVKGSWAGYDIWEANCHTAANVTVCSLKDAGIVACGGRPQNQNNPQNHTFNYVLEGNEVCFYNWGVKKCCPGTKIPPDLTGRCESQIVADFCKKQPGKPFPLDPGELVEIPGPAACVKEVEVSLSGGSRASCEACCDRRAEMWPAEKWGTDAREQFRQDCKRSCRGFFD